MGHEHFGPRPPAKVHVPRKTEGGENGERCLSRTLLASVTFSSPAASIRRETQMELRATWTLRFNNSPSKLLHVVPSRLHVPEWTHRVQGVKVTAVNSTSSWLKRPDSPTFHRHFLHGIKNLVQWAQTGTCHCGPSKGFSSRTFFTPTPCWAELVKHLRGKENNLSTFACLTCKWQGY